MACAAGGAGTTSTNSTDVAATTGTDGATTDGVTTDGVTTDSEASDPGAPRADVDAVAVAGSPGAYTFSVTLRSDDLGCEQYADWWEVLTEDGSLLYRRILAHSHVDEQPFTRSGGPVAANADQRVFVRAHMNPSGYVGDALMGTPAGGFAAASDVEFPASLETAEPQPDGCAF